MRAPSRFFFRSLIQPNPCLAPRGPRSRLQFFLLAGACLTVAKLQAAPQRGASLLQIHLNFLWRRSSVTMEVANIAGVPGKRESRANLLFAGLLNQTSVLAADGDNEKAAAGDAKIVGNLCQRRPFPLLCRIQLGTDELKSSSPPRPPLASQSVMSLALTGG